jgi:hypothetical protein
MGVSGSIFSGSRPLLGTAAIRQAQRANLGSGYVTHAQVLVQLSVPAAAAAAAAAGRIDSLEASTGFVDKSKMLHSVHVETRLTSCMQTHNLCEAGIQLSQNA